MPLPQQKPGKTAHQLVKLQQEHMRAHHEADRLGAPVLNRAGNPLSLYERLSLLCRPSDHAPLFSPAAAQGVSWYEVRTRWPKNKEGSRCPRCGALLVPFASVEHMRAGQWLTVEEVEP